MKNLIFLLIGFFGFCQPIKIDTAGLPPEIKQVATEIKKEAEKTPVIEKETKKEFNKIQLLMDRFEKILSKKNPKASQNKETKILHVSNDSAALKPNTEVVYWEEVERKWTGRLFHSSDTKIRLYKHDENGKIIYLD